MGGGEGGFDAGAVGANGLPAIEFPGDGGRATVGVAGMPAVGGAATPAMVSENPPGFTCAGVGKRAAADSIAAPMLAAPTGAGDCGAAAGDAPVSGNTAFGASVGARCFAAPMPCVSGAEGRSMVSLPTGGQSSSGG